ncbi:UvrD-helicase domain-containing protein [Streptomonospora salina]|uniref:DNA 3'-5' helicase n=1 Tax=Streptomonospora salina TaxID=104205 RepID=A0A841ECQ1_9ACTN|nr:UvrD-helicase domain-containing protein [Streptomonospora salina]MBB5998240.1 superfamily I DNA/RNA helicase [Streptomonospora salina]
MTAPAHDAPALTDEQNAVVEQPVDALTLVTAAAGSGKTHTLIRRLGRLVERGDVAPRDVLALSFSRASVRELRRRLTGYGDAGHVRAQTFDSWALDLLMQVKADQDWRSASFDERIREAAKALDDGLADDLYEDLRHVVVDEVQDLMGERRELVRTLLERFDCGFTVVGDPAQAIYGFQLEDTARRAGETNRFFDRLRSTFAEELVELHLTRNFRAATDEARLALPHGPALRTGAEQGGGGDDLYETLRSELRSALPVGKLEDDHVVDHVADPDGTAAVLCRTNGQALLVSSRLHSAGVAHRLQRGAQDRAAPAWLARFFAPESGPTLTRESFDAVLAEHADAAVDPDTAWRALASTAAGRTGRTVDLRRLRDAVSNGLLPDELAAAPPAAVVVSSFHRAKGLEFDRVVVADPGPLREAPEIDAAEEARVLYVAMTRSRTELLRMDPVDSRRVGLHQGTRRWQRYGFKNWQRFGMESTADDVHADDPAGTAEFTDDPHGLQRYLSTEVSAGDPIVLDRVCDESLEDRESPPYLVRHAGRPIGIVSERFRRDLYRVLNVNRGFVPRNFPYEITDVRVDTVETVTGSPAAGKIAGLGDHGVWTAPRLTGLGRFHFRREEADE